MYEDLEDSLLEAGVRKVRRLSGNMSNEIQMCCPFHNDNTPSAYFNVVKGKFICFACRIAFNYSTFIRELKLADVTAIKNVKLRFSRSDESFDVDYNKFIAAQGTDYGKAVKYYKDAMPLSSSKRAISYLEKRLGYDFFMPLPCKYHEERDSLVFKGKFNYVEKFLEGKYKTYGTPVHLFTDLTPDMDFDYINIVEGTFDYLIGRQIDIPTAALLTNDVGPYKLGDILKLLNDRDNGYRRYVVYTPDNDKHGLKAVKRIVHDLESVILPGRIYLSGIIDGVKDYGEMEFEEIAGCLADKECILDVYMKRLDKHA